MSKFLFFFALTTFSLTDSAWSSLTFSASAAAAKANLSSQISASYSIEVPESPIEVSFGLDSSSFRSRTTYVEEVGISNISGSETSGSFGLGLFKTAYFDFRFSTGAVNSANILTSEFAVAPRFNFGDFSLGFSFETKTTKQNEPYYILIRNIQSELDHKQTTHTIRLAYQVTERFGLGLSHSQKSYDKDMETMLNVLTNPTLATNNGIDMLSQINGLLQAVTEISGQFSASERSEIELSVGRIQDFYDPKSISSDARLGFLFYQTSALTWGFGVTSGKSELDSEVSRSLDGTLVYTF